MPDGSTGMLEAASALSDFAALFEHAFRLARDRFAQFAMSVIVLTGLNAAGDLVPKRIFWPIVILASLAIIYLEAAFFASVLGLDPVPTIGRRFLPIIALGVLDIAGFLIGLMLLVIPGLVLLLRWSIALPILLIEERGAYESLRQSWRLTAAFWKLASPIPIVVLLAYLPFWLLDWLTAYPDLPVSMLLAVHFYASLVIAFQWLLCIALYRHVRLGIPDVRLPDIFS